MRYFGTREVIQSGIGWRRHWTRGERRGMKLTLRTDGKGQREITTEGLGGAYHRGGFAASESWWLDLLRAAGVEVEIVQVAPTAEEKGAVEK